MTNLVAKWVCSKCGETFVVDDVQADTHLRFCDGPARSERQMTEPGWVFMPEAIHKVSAYTWAGRRAECALTSEFLPSVQGWDGVTCPECLSVRKTTQPHPETMTPVENVRARLAEVKALCEAATPGPWRVEPGKNGQWIYGGPSFYDEVVTPEQVECSSYCYGGSSAISTSETDAAFIAAASPDLMLRLVEWAEDVLDRHGKQRSPYDANCECTDLWPCRDVEAVIKAWTP